VIDPLAPRISVSRFVFRWVQHSATHEDFFLERSEGWQRLMG
jgi:hypothetical protein